MTNGSQRWIRRFMVGAAAITLPASAMAREFGPEMPADCAAMPPPRGLPPPPATRFDVPPAALIPPLPSLQGVELTEAQEDKLFELLMAQAPAERAVVKEAAKTQQEMRRLVNGDGFDAEKMRALADAHAHAMARLFLMQAELNAKVRGLLTPEQRAQSEALRRQPRRCAEPRS